jgi:RNA polymerase sigma-70 factor (ECF subfamily)
MPSTSASLLECLREPGDQVAWQRFVDLYTPLIVAWGRRVGLQEADVADLTQDVLCVIARTIPKFDYQKDRSFRGWLRTVTVNKWRERERRAKLPTEPGASSFDLVGPEDPVDDFWENEYRERIVARALELMRDEFHETTWKAFWGVVVQSRSGIDVATELGITLGAVYAAKSRVLRKLRTELAGLTD